MREQTKGVVYNIQRYNLHDGPGIRTIIFLKGCPLRCPWCANPESQNMEPERMDGETVGYLITASEAVDRAARDAAFFRRSGGGITISGGELLAQPDFAEAVVSEAKERGLSVTLETSCFAGWDTFYRVAAKADLVLADIKLLDRERHREALGVPNDQILENISRYAASGGRVIVRVPVVPGVNGDGGNLRATAEFCRKAGIGEMHLLAYHELGAAKYGKLGRPYEMAGVRPPSKEALRDAASMWEQEFGIEIKVL